MYKVNDYAICYVTYKCDFITVVLARYVFIDCKYETEDNSEKHVLSAIVCTMFKVIG